MFPSSIMYSIPRRMSCLTCEIEYIQEQEELTRDEIAQIEWLYLQTFRFEQVKPRYLEEEIINNPGFFAQLVMWIFRPDEGEREKEDFYPFQSRDKTGTYTV